MASADMVLGAAWAGGDIGSAFDGVPDASAACGRSGALHARSQCQKKYWGAQSQIPGQTRWL